MKTKNSRRIRRKWPQLMRLTPLLLFLNKWGIDRLVFKRLDFKRLAVKELDFKRLDYEGFMVKEIYRD